MSEDFLINGIPYESHQEKDGKVITLKASQYHTQKMVDNAIDKVRSNYANRNLSRIIVKVYKVDGGEG
jgi:hypothetical protein